MTETFLKRGGCAIVGAAESDLGEVAPGLTALDLMGQAAARALNDAGLLPSDVDGLFATSSQVRMASLALAEYLKIAPKYQDSSFNGGSVFETMVAHAVAAIETGLCSVALIAYGSTQRSASKSGGGAARLVSVRGYDPMVTPHGGRMPMTAYAMAAARHMHQYGTERKHLAEVVVAARQWALMNPVAWEKKPITIDEVLAAPVLSTPLSARDACLVTDGGGAVILVSAERAKSLRKPPVYILGMGDAISHYEIQGMPDLTRTCAVESGQRAFKMAGIGVDEVDVAQLYDAFSINTILFLEDLGFCKKGEGGGFVETGAIAPGGRLPVNTNGGGLSYGHPGLYGMQLLVEATRQIRGECGERQVQDCNVAVAHGNGGILSTQSTVILGSEATL
jgi:acetyl-CoA acetyltransferase